jgi:hypothetical protein
MNAMIVVMMMEKLVELMVLAGETEVLGENLPRRHLAWIGFEVLTSVVMKSSVFCGIQRRVVR